jgi:site-specific DNA-methyltransferase (adenine-specific)
VTTPYYQDDHVTIYHGDCREVLPTLDKADLLLTDPPYGLGDKWNGGGGSQGSSWRFNPDEAKSWDASIVDGLPDMMQLARLSIVWGGNYYHLPPARCWLLWDKKQNDQWTTAQAEMAWTNLDRPVRVFRMSQVEAYGAMDKQHPTQKPLKLMTWCIAMTQDDSIATVLDPFMGSGTTLRAAKDLGRKAIGIELSERYCEIAANRMGQEVLDFGGVA